VLELMTVVTLFSWRGAEVTAAARGLMRCSYLRSGVAR
jgi:hypothetical protein